MTSQTPALPLKAIDTPLPTAGDFGARVADGALEVPQVLFDALRQARIRTAAEMLSIAEAFPSSLAHTLGWGPEDIRQATDKLRIILKGHVPEDLLNPPPRATPPLDARPPLSRDHQPRQP